LSWLRLYSQALLFLHQFVCVSDGRKRSGANRIATLPEYNALRTYLTAQLGRSLRPWRTEFRVGYSGQRRASCLSRILPFPGQPYLSLQSAAEVEQSAKISAAAPEILPNVETGGLA
jgi:hypothetical protein